MGKRKYIQFFFIGCMVFILACKSEYYAYRLSLYINQGLMIDTVEVFKHNDIFLYKIPEHIYMNIKFRSSLGGQVVPLDSIHMPSMYFVYREKKLKGLLLKPNGAIQIVNADSLLRNRGYRGTYGSLDSIRFVKTIKEGQEIKEMVCVNDYPDSVTRLNYIDTLFCYFDAKAKSIPFSLSPALDSLTHSKLVIMKTKTVHKDNGGIESAILQLSEIPFDKTLYNRIVQKYKKQLDALP